MGGTDVIDESSRWILGAGVATGAVAVGAMWLPWFSSGSAGRNSFAAFRAAEILGIGWVTPFRVFWFLLPIVLLASGLAWLLGFNRPAALGVTTIGAILSLSGVVALASLGLEVGSTAAVSAGLCTTLLGVLGRGS